GRELASNQPARLEAVDEPGDVGGVAGQGLGEPSHRQRPPRLDEVQDVALGRRGAGARSAPRQGGAPGREEIHQELPGAAGGGFAAHRPRLYLRNSIVDYLKYIYYDGVTMNRLRIIPLDETVVFPGMPVTLPVDVGGDALVLLVPRHDNTYAKVGV